MAHEQQSVISCQSTYDPASKHDVWTGTLSCGCKFLKPKRGPAPRRAKCNLHSERIEGVPVSSGLSDTTEREMTDAELARDAGDEQRPDFTATAGSERPTLPIPNANNAPSTSSPIQDSITTTPTTAPNHSIPTNSTVLPIDFAPLDMVDGRIPCPKCSAKGDLIERDGEWWLCPECEHVWKPVEIEIPHDPVQEEINHYIAPVPETNTIWPPSPEIVEALTVALNALPPSQKSAVILIETLGDKVVSAGEFVESPTPPVASVSAPTDPTHYDEHGRMILDQAAINRGLELWHKSFAGK